MICRKSGSMILYFSVQMRYTLFRQKYTDFIFRLRPQTRIRQIIHVPPYKGVQIMKKSISIAVIAILAVLSAVFGILYFTGLTDRAGKIEALSADLSGKEGQIESLNADVAEKSKQIESLSDDVTEKNRQIESLNTDIAEKSKQIESLNADVAKKAGQIESLNTDVAEKAGQIEYLNTDLAEKTRQIGILNTDAAEKAGQIKTLNTAVSEKDRQIERLTADVKEKDGQIITLSTDVSEKSSQVETLIAESGKKDDRITELEKEVRALTPPTPEPSPVPTEKPVAPELHTEASAEADPGIIKNTTVYSGGKTVTDYRRSDETRVNMPAVGEYTRIPVGILTYRTDSFRQNAAVGTVSGEGTLKLEWMAEAGRLLGAKSVMYDGIGWTGQPAIVKWTKEVRENSNLYDSKKEKSGLKEVIIAGLDGQIHFLDLADGTSTRDSINLGYPMRGTPSLHPSGYPYLTVGQYARRMKTRTGNIGLRQYDLFTQKEFALIDGLDLKYGQRGFSKNGSFETSALIDRTSDTMITAGSNGLLYVTSLGSIFDHTQSKYVIAPSTVVLRGKTASEKVNTLTAVEASVAMYEGYAFYADMGGIVRCVDVNAMKTDWAVETGDAVESTPALDFNSSGGLDLYTANMLINRRDGDVSVRCLNAMTGEQKWQFAVNVKKNTTNIVTSSGFRASPVIGQENLSDLVFYTVTGLSEEGASALGLAPAKAAVIALEKKSGSLRWAYGLSSRSDSSPVAVYDASGNGRVVQCSSDGRIVMLDGLTGQEVSSLKVVGTIEASPAVYNGIMVIGTTGAGKSFIYGIAVN